MLFVGEFLVICNIVVKVLFFSFVFMFVFSVVSSLLVIYFERVDWFILIYLNILFGDIKV